MALRAAKEFRELASCFSKGLHFRYECLTFSASSGKREQAPQGHISGLVIILMSWPPVNTVLRMAPF